MRWGGAETERRRSARSPKDNVLALIQLCHRSPNQLDVEGDLCVAGMVTEHAGRIPRKGEIVEDEGLRIEVLEATDRRVEKVRITFLGPEKMKMQ